MLSRGFFAVTCSKGVFGSKTTTVSLQVEAEANIATSVPLPALEGGAWNTIYELELFESQHSLGRWFLDTNRRHKTYRDIYSLLRDL